MARCKKPLARRASQREMMMVTLKTGAKAAATAVCVHMVGVISRVLHLPPFLPTAAGLQRGGYLIHGIERSAVQLALH